MSERRRRANATNRPGRPLLVLAFAVLVGTVYAAATPAARGEEPATRQKSGCVEYWGEARYIVNGYNHIVVLQSRCEGNVECEVWTNVNPDRQNVALAPKARAEVLTFRESPARVFTPYASCR